MPRFRPRSISSTGSWNVVYALYKHLVGRFRCFADHAFFTRVSGDLGVKLFDFLQLETFVAGYFRIQIADGLDKPGDRPVGVP